jgi:hypothetical protein
MGEALDPAGPLVVVLMPAETPYEFQRAWALVVPVRDTGAAIEAMGAQAGEGDIWVWTLNPAAEPFHLATGDKRLVIGANAEVVKKVAGNKEGITAKFKPADLNLFHGLDLVMWFDAARVIELFRMTIDGFVNMGIMMQAAGDPAATKQAEASKEQVKVFLDGTSAVAMGLGLDQAGLTMRFGFRTKAGSELAKRMKVPAPAGDLLQGLPAENYMLVAGQIMDPEQSREAVKSLEPQFAMLETIEGIDKEQVGRIKDILEEWAPLITGTQFAANSLEPGPDGILGVATIMRVTDSAKWLKLFREAVDVGLKMLAAEDLADNEDVQIFREALSYDTDAEELAGVKLDHLKFDLNKIEDLEEEDVEDALKIIGKEGVLVRVGAAGAGKTIITFGGGPAYTGKVIELLTKDAAPLAADPGIRSTAIRLPKERHMVGFMALDRILGCIGNGAKALDEEEEFPIRMPKLETPAAMSGSGADNLMRVDSFVPTELMVATKDMIMMLMGTGGPAPAPAGPGEPPA